MAAAVEGAIWTGVDLIVRGGGLTDRRPATSSRPNPVEKSTRPAGFSAATDKGVNN
jgi:hypothetical protein